MAPPTPGRPPTVEREAFATNGLVGLVFVLAFFGGAVLFGLLSGGAGSLVFIVLAGLCGLFALFCMGGFFVLEPNQAEVLKFLGRYRGTVQQNGWYWTNPFTTKRKISLRAQNFNTPKLKVNDADGNPIEIAAVVVWRVRDTARASFDVEHYPQFIEVQSETALRHIATTYPYDVGNKPNEPTLRGSADLVASDLQRELQERLDRPGIEVIETRLTHLAYSPEIAGAMLQRQQAAAIIAARQRIATGAVGIVETVLADLSKNGVVKLTPDQKAQMVGSLLVVLTSDRGAQPVLSTGSTS